MYQLYKFYTLNILNTFTVAKVNIKKTYYLWTYLKVDGPSKPVRRGFNMA